MISPVGTEVDFAGYIGVAQNQSVTKPPATPPRKRPKEISMATPNVNAKVIEEGFELPEKEQRLAMESRHGIDMHTEVTLKPGDVILGDRGVHDVLFTSRVQEI